MGARAGRVNRDDDGRAALLAMNPDRRAAMARAGVDAVEELPSGDPIEALGMFPLRAMRFVGRIAGNVEQA